MFKIGQTVHYHVHTTLGHDAWICGVATGQVISADDNKVCVLPPNDPRPIFVAREFVFAEYSYAWAFSYGAANQCKRANDPDGGRGCGYGTILFVCGDYREVLKGTDIPEVVGWK